MVKIDDTYFDDNLEEQLQEPAPVATDDESVTEPEPRPLLGDLLDEDSSSEIAETDTPSDSAPAVAALDQADDEVAGEVASTPSTPESTPLEEPSALEELEADDADEELSEEPTQSTRCLLYTSDAADDSLRVDLGGRRIIKKQSYHAKQRGFRQDVCHDCRCTSFD